MKRTLVLSTALALASALPAAAQIRIPPVQLVTGVGYSQGTSLGFLGNRDGAAFASHRNAAAFQVGLQTPSGVRGVDLRLSLQYSNPTLQMDKGDLALEPVYRTGITTLTMDALVHLPRVIGARPYVLAGAGLKRYDFKQTYYRASNQPVVPDDEITPTLRLGAGAAWSLGRNELFVEASGTTNRLENRVDGPFSDRVQNFTYMMGLKIPLKR